MSDNKSNNEISLPESLRQKFASLERRLLRVETTAAVCVGLLGVLGSFAILFFSDRFIETPVGLRATLLVAAIAIIALAVIRWFRWIILRRDLRALSVIVQRKFRELGDHFLGIVVPKRSTSATRFFCEEPFYIRRAIRRKIKL